MNCDMSVHVEGPDQRGWNKWSCSRVGCSRKTDWTLHRGTEIRFGGCKGLPLAREWREWIDLFSFGGLTRAAAVCKFIRWRAKGSPLEELPPGVPSPGMIPMPSDAELAELRQADPTLIGSRLEAMFKAIGVPTCGGCEQRRDWLNRAHEWLRGSNYRPPIC